MTPSPSHYETRNTAAAAHFVHAAVKLLHVIRRRRRVFLAIVLIVCLLGLAYGVFAPRVYQAKASLMITPAGTEAFSSQPTAEYQNQALIPTFERLVASSVVLEGALDLLAREDPDKRIDFAGQAPEQYSRVLRSGLYSSGPRRTRMVDVGYRSKSPEAAEAVLTAVVESYLAFIDENHRNISLEVKKILDGEREQVERTLLEKEAQLVRLKHQLRDPGTDQQEDLLHPVIQRATQMNEAFVEASLRRLEMEALVAAAGEAVERGGNVGTHLLGLQPEVGRAMVLNTFGVYGKDSYLIARMRADLVEEQARLKSLRVYLGNAHPHVREAAANVANLQQHLEKYDNIRIGSLEQLHDRELGAALVAVAQQELSQARQHERKLQTEYDRAEAEAIALSGRIAQVTLLDHDRELLSQLHEVLLNRAAELRITQEHSDVHVSIVTEPTAPREAVSPSFAFIGIVCLVLGIGGGGLVAYVLDALDDRFRSADEVAGQLQTDLLGVLPPMTPGEAVGCEAVQVHTAPDAAESEAFRTLRSVLNLSAQEVGRVVVSSAEPGDGKTTVLANLAASHAQAGKRTLMIDGDMRRPGLTKLFGLRGLEGLSDVLRSPSPAADVFARCVLPSGVPGLDILPCGARPQHPSELLSSKQFPALLAWAETVYHQILIDSPPILAASDSTIIGRIADGLLLVVQPAKNHRRMVLRAVEAVRSFGVRVVGVAVNRMSSDRERDDEGLDSAYREEYACEDYGDDPEEEDAETFAVRFVPHSDEIEPPAWRRAA